MTVPGKETWMVQMKMRAQDRVCFDIELRANFNSE